MLFFMQLFFCHGFSQIDKEIESPRDRIFFGGNLGLSFGSVTDIQISPQVGYYITKRCAAQIYAAVIADFSWIAEKWKNDVALPQTSVSALHCLKVALQKMLIIKTQNNNSAQLTTLFSKIKRIEMG